MAEGGAKFENKWGTIKIKSVSTCLRKTHVHGELEIPKFYFKEPPYFRGPKCFIQKIFVDKHFFEAQNFPNSKAGVIW